MYLCSDGNTSLVLISLLNTCSCSVESTNARSINLLKVKKLFVLTFASELVKKTYSKISTFKSER